MLSFFCSYLTNIIRGPLYTYITWLHIQQAVNFSTLCQNINGIEYKNNFFQNVLIYMYKRRNCTNGNMTKGWRSG